MGLSHDRPVRRVLIGLPVIIVIIIIIIIYTELLLEGDCTICIIIVVILKCMLQCTTVGSSCHFKLFIYQKENKVCVCVIVTHHPPPPPSPAPGGDGCSALSNTIM